MAMMTYGVVREYRRIHPGGRIVPKPIPHPRR